MNAYGEMTAGWLTKLKLYWLGYRYRFVPWIVVNFKNRRVRKVLEPSKENIEDTIALDTLERYFCALHENDTDAKEDQSLCLEVMDRILKFSISCSASTVSGTGVFVSSGQIKKGSLVALYPGTVYQPYEPILFQSLANPFIFRCIDGVLIDGKDSGLSRMIYRSCGHRDQVGSYATCDFSWLGSVPYNPLAIGQYVNNETRDFPANVAYQELDIPSSFPLKYLKYIPNISYSFRTYASEINHVRTVVLIALRDIDQSEELFSSYFTVVY